LTGKTPPDRIAFQIHTLGPEVEDMKRLAAMALLLILLPACRFSVRVQEEEKFKPPVTPLGMDILYLDKGEEYPGRLEKVKEDGTYVFTHMDSRTVEYPPEQVLRVEFQRKRPDDDKTQASQINDRILKEALKTEVTPEKYPESAYVTIYDSFIVNIEKDRSYTVTRRYIRKILARRGMETANDYIDYLADQASARMLFARTIDEKGGLSHIDESAIEDGSRFGRYPQYDNARRLKWSLKNIDVNRYIDCCYELRFSPATALKPLYLRKYMQLTEPLIYCEVVVKAAPGVDVVVTGLGTQDNDRITTFMKSGPLGTTHTVVSSNMPRLETENLMPPYADLLPWVAVSLKDSWKRIAGEYAAKLSALVPQGLDSPVARKANDLTRDKESALEKARALYNFVAADIGFLNISPVEYSFMPHSPEETLAAGQANALDKAFLLHAMLKWAGVESSLLLAHRRDYGCLPRENASLLPMDTPILKVAAGDGGVYCCPTTQFVRFGYIPSGIQGFTALRVEPADAALVEAAVPDSSTESVTTHSEISLGRDGRVRVKRTEKPQGAAEAAWREWSALKPEEIRQKFERVVSRIHPGAKLIDYSPKQPSELGDLNRPVAIEYEYEAGDYCLAAGGELLAFKIPELDYDASSIQKYERDLPLFWERRKLVENTAVIKLPDGFRVRSVPEQVKSYEGSRPFISYEASFAVKEGTLVFKDRFERTGIYEPPQMYEVYIKAIKDSARLANDWVVIEKPN
jgi:hypothetical protein